MKGGQESAGKRDREGEGRARLHAFKRLAGMPGSQCSSPCFPAVLNLASSIGRCVLPPRRKLTELLWYTLVHVKGWTQSSLLQFHLAPPEDFPLSERAFHDGYQAETSTAACIYDASDTGPGGRLQRVFCKLAKRFEYQPEHVVAVAGTDAAIDRTSQF